MSTGLRSVTLFGLPFVDASSIEPVVESVANFTPTDRALHAVSTPNVDHLVQLDRQRDPAGTTVTNASAWILPDGQPIVWAARLLRSPLSARLPGSTLVTQLWPRLVKDGRRLLVIATTPAVAQLIEADAGPGTAVVAPQIGPDGQGIDVLVTSCLDLIDPAGAPEFVFVTLGFPKQCAVTLALLERWPAEAPAPLFLGVSASFDMLYGLKKRAPALVQRLGLEWFYRFAQEPRRLFVRYFVRDPLFVSCVVREWRTRRAGP